MVYRVAGPPTRFNSNASVLFALVFARYDAIVHCVGMEHDRTEVKEKETEAPTGRRECSQ
jgi:hypothetical protein